MGAGHSHGPSPEEAATAPDFRRKLGIAFVLVFSIVIAQGIGAWVTGSLALLVDVVHSLTDSIGLLVALVAAVLMIRPPTSKRTDDDARLLHSPAPRMVVCGDLSMNL